MTHDPDPIVTAETWEAVCANASHTHRATLEELTDRIVGKPMSHAPAVLAGSLAELTGMTPEAALRAVDPPRRRDRCGSWVCVDDRERIVASDRHSRRDRRRAEGRRIDCEIPRSEHKVWRDPYTYRPTEIDHEGQGFGWNVRL